ncbi:hypothetical protein NC653_024225 [Populus alba x Populus x berolinensis]|uniref:Uncharacterized protein n=1 Tax=Populus alba x Populus x berolinensis TaxID=444605 RepID=A0AAD6Q6D6_9ROSI|nr:hypothetical protein NC653_024225 [Populus alba x Populus x berolinensis]
MRRCTRQTETFTLLKFHFQITKKLVLLQRKSSTFPLILLDIIHLFINSSS